MHLPKTQPHMSLYYTVSVPTLILLNIYFHLMTSPSLQWDDV